jgi:glycosyltransferase involved in cell wall biosynthesis
MNLLVVAPYFAPAWAYGGPTPFLRSLCRELAALPGWHVRALTSTALAPATDSVAGVDVVDGVTVERLPRRHGLWPRTFFRMPALRPALRRELAMCDAVLLHGVWTDVNRIGHSECRRAGIPYLVYTHGAFTAWALAHHAPQKIVYFPLFERAVLNSAAGIVIGNDSEVRELRERGVRAQLRRIPGGVDLPVEQDVAVPSALRAKIGARPFVLCLGRLDPQKGLDVLIDGFASSLAADGYALVLAGPDIVGDRAGLEARADRLGVSDRVVFPGLVVGDEKEWLLRNATVYAQVSRSEGTSIAVLEALAHGIPTVLSTAAAFPELDGSGAAEVVRADPDAVAAGLRAVVRSTAGPNSNAAAMLLIRQRFTWPAIARTTASYIEECVR